MGFFAYDNRLTGTGVWTDTGASFEATPPIANLGTRQVPAPNAEFTGDTAAFSFAAQDDAGAAENFTARVIGLLAHDLPDGATVTFKNEADVTLASATVSRFKTRPSNMILLLGSDETIHTLKCSISGAGSGTHRIGALFAGPAKVYDQEGGQNFHGISDATITRIGGTDWDSPGVRRRGFTLSARGTRGDVLGIKFDGTEFSGDDWVTALEKTGMHGPVIVAPSSQSQRTIDAVAIYGALDSFEEPERIGPDLWQIRFAILESR